MLQAEPVAPLLHQDIILGLTRRPGVTFFRYPKNSMVFLQADRGSWLFYLEEGLVKLSVYTPAGDERIVQFTNSGQIFGEHASVLNVPYGVTATTMTESRIYRIPRSQMLSYAERHPQFASLLYTSLSRKLVGLGRQLAHASFQDAYGRVASAICDLGGALQSSVSCNGHVELYITHQELANYIGCNRVTITNALSYLEGEGLIKKSHRRIIVRDMARLRGWTDQRAAGANLREHR